MSADNSGNGNGEEKKQEDDEKQDAHPTHSGVDTVITVHDEPHHIDDAEDADNTTTPNNAEEEMVPIDDEKTNEPQPSNTMPLQQPPSSSVPQEIPEDEKQCPTDALDPRSNTENDNELTLKQSEDQKVNSLLDVDNPSEPNGNGVHLRDDEEQGDGNALNPVNSVNALNHRNVDAEETKEEKQVEPQQERNEVESNLNSNINSNLTSNLNSNLTANQLNETTDNNHGNAISGISENGSRNSQDIADHPANDTLSNCINTINPITPSPLPSHRTIVNLNDSHLFGTNNPNPTTSGADRDNREIQNVPSRDRLSAMKPKRRAWPRELGLHRVHWAKPQSMIEINVREHSHHSSASSSSKQPTLLWFVHDKLDGHILDRCNYHGICSRL